MTWITSPDYDLVIYDLADDSNCEGSSGVTEVIMQHPEQQRVLHFL